MSSSPALIRPMGVADLAEVAAVTNTAFGALHSDPDGERFPTLMFQTRLAADPAGCFVAASREDPRQLTGALFSVARGGLGWFGPLAVHPRAQRGGVGRELTAACLESWQARGVRLMGLETFADSPLHVHMYSKMGFRPAWTGVTFSRPLGETAMPAGVGVHNGPAHGPLPDLSYLYPGLDVSGEAAATLSCAAGVVLTTGDGVALCHLEPTFQAAQTGYLPFLAARSRESFGLLLAAAEHLSREAGCTSLFTRMPGSAWATMDALVARGYRAGGAMLRMKRGENLDYDRTGTYYCDNWL